MKAIAIFSIPVLFGSGSIWIAPLADYYWGVVYLYALKKLFTTKYEMISDKDLARVLLKDE